MFKSSSVSLLLIAISAMLIQQTMATVAKSAVPVLFKAIADDVGFDAELVLFYTWIFACAGIVVMLGCGGFIIRLGALRVSQWGCILMALGLGLTALTFGNLWIALFILSLASIINSIGSTAATPASSQILAKYSPTKWSPLVFSIKQSGVPAGVAIASFVCPILALAYGWRTAALLLAIISIFIAVGLQPLRREFDRDRDPSHKLGASRMGDTFASVLRDPALRLYAATGFAFIGLQAIFTNFTIVYLAEELNYTLAEAGAAMGLAVLIAAPGRIFWGWVSSTFIKPRTLLAILAIIMAMAGMSMGLYTQQWPHYAIMVPMLLISATTLSWHGVLLSEIAQHSSGTQVGRMTGGVLAFGTAGQIFFPLVFWLGYLAYGYPGAFIAVSLPSAWIAGALLAYR